MKFYAISEKGRREKNEDSFIAKKINDYYVFAVADGLGGHKAGEIASKIAIIELEETVKRFKGSPKDVLKRAVEKANEEVYFQSKEYAYKGMATTLVACLLDSTGRGTIANVGDSRAYLIGDEVWHTRDHSYVQELIDAGIIDEGEALRHPMRNVVTKAIGIDKKVDPDLYDIDVRDKILLLSSDGLHDYVRDEDIRAIVKEEEDLEKACKRLVRKALEAGSTDNITVIIAEF